jgi:hypothetical protein
MISNAKCSWFKWSLLSVTLLAAAVCGRPAQGQDALPAVRVGGVDITGIPEDWSHRYVVFSNPGTEQEAIQSGDYARWQKIVNEPRYVIQQLKRNALVQGPAAVDTGYRSRWISQADGVRSGLEAPADDALTIRSGPRPWPIFWRDNPSSDTKKDWSETLGGPGVAAGQYPAKYSFSTTTASCNDFVVFPTGAAGSNTQATIIAFNNIYVGTEGCELSNPTVYWAFNTPPGGTATDSATANLSPVLSLDGTQLAFVENYSNSSTSTTTAYLVILRMAAESGSAYNDPSNAVVYKAPGSYNGCTAPCYTTLSLSASDTSSAPFYIYSSADTLYVGDDSGKVHEVTGVFNGTPTIDPTGWPVTASTETDHALNSPVYDSTSENLFVGDSGGYLHQFAPSSPGTVNTSYRLENNTVGVFDSPLIDSTTEEVYALVGYSGDDSTPSNSSYMNRFAAGSSIADTYGTGLDFKNGGGSTENPSTSIMRAGAFDDQYFASSEDSGHLYVCENGVLYQVPMPAFSTVNTFNTAVSTISGSTCSPVTEFLGVMVSTTINETGGITAGATTMTVTSGTGIVNDNYIQVDSEILQVTAVDGTTLTISRGQLGTTAAAHANGAAVQDIKDWLFLSVAANGNAASCTGACLYNYNVIGAGTSGTPIAGLAASGGTSGIVVDNQSTTQVGAEQIYYNTITGDTAVQASQSNP